MQAFTISPRFSETNGAGHICHTAFLPWLEQAREPLFHLLVRKEGDRQLGIIIKKIDMEFFGEVFYGKPVEIHTDISGFGETSFTVEQSLHQEGRLALKTSTVIVQLDYGAKRPEPLSEEMKLHILGL